MQAKPLDSAHFDSWPGWTDRPIGDRVHPDGTIGHPSNGLVFEAFDDKGDVIRFPVARTTQRPRR